MPRWTVTVGNDDIITIERTPTGLVDISIRTGREVIATRATRAEVEDLRRKLGAAIADDESHHRGV